MKTTAVLVLAAGTCGAGFLASWLIFRGDGACKVEVPPAQPARVEPTEPVRARVAESAPELDESDSRLAVAPPESLLEGVSSASSRQAASPRFSDFLSMPESTRIELEAKAKAIREAFPVYTHPAFEAQIAAGRIHPELWDESDDPKTMHDDADLTLCTKDQIHGFFRVVLPRSEYPDLYELHDCLNRLRKQIRELEHGDFTAKREEQNARMRK